ncbi:Gfo/Idh/MocA family protein [Lentzea nigeriaca]|uniref:Gfo/Idh/MocA family protein n=1 Tax=Lentzea nigeriaca TaxID=1128665 RepID=UPI0019571EE0|nr:Gfo/Idh/MocA family oxidoreductase [Lentzea nigeriaca]MBM7862188.1 putative dehydrogenase [Lentzea nigeriaca]
MTAPVRIGVLGCSAFAQRRMIPAFLASADVTLAAVASRDKAKAEALAGELGCRAVHGYEALLADPEIDAVYTPLPAALHAEWVEASLLAGKHVLAEKPLTLNRNRTAALLELAGELGLALLENVMFVHHSQHAAVRKLVADGMIGELRSFRAEFAIPRQPDGDIRYNPQLGGGALWDTGVYPVRAALHLLEAELTVAGATLTGPGFDVDTRGAALLSTVDGVPAQLAFGLEHGYRNTYELSGTEGRITLERVFTPPADYEPTVLLERDSVPHRITLPADDQVANTVAAFAAAVRVGAAPHDNYLEQARLLEEILIAAL